jgi:hypothetical protein
MSTDEYFVTSQFTRHNKHLFASAGISVPQKRSRQTRTEFTVEPSNVFYAGDLRGAYNHGVDNSLNLDMSERLQLQVSFVRLFRVISLKRAFYVDGMSLMSLYEIAVIAVHGAH